MPLIMPLSFFAVYKWFEPKNWTITLKVRFLSQIEYYKDAWAKKSSQKNTKYSENDILEFKNLETRLLS